MGKRKVRRQFSADFKRKVVAQTGTAGTSISAVAWRHDVNANTVRRWRDDPRYAPQAQSFLPVEIKRPVEDPQRDDDPSTPSELGIWIAGDVRLVVKGGFEPEGLGRLIRSIRTAP